MLLEWLRRHQNTAVPLLLYLISLSLLSHRAYSRHSIQPSLFSRAVVSVVGYAQMTATGTVTGIENMLDRYLFLAGVEEENQRLKLENHRLRRQLAALEEKGLENERLRKLCGFERSGQDQWVPARVIGESVGGVNKVLTINRGSRDGVRPRMPVISYDGAVVGQILDEPGSVIGFDSSQVLLITDRRSRIPVMIQRPESRARGILVGVPERGECEMSPAEKLAVVEPGDLVITSGFGRVFPRGRPVGRVIEVDRDPSRLFLLIRVEPLADFRRLEEVLVMLKSEET